MVAPVKRRPEKSTAAWHAGFLSMLPVIRDYARGAFGHLKAELRQDLIQEVIANAMVAYVRLFEQGKVALAFPTVLANFAIRQVRDHRRVGNRLNVKDALSPYCQKHKGVVVQRLDVFDEEENAWKEAVVEDTRSAPVSDIVAFRCDFSDWLKSLRRRDRRIASRWPSATAPATWPSGSTCRRAGSRSFAANWPRVGGRSWATSLRPKRRNAVAVCLEGRPARAMRAGRPSRSWSLEGAPHTSFRSGQHTAGSRSARPYSARHAPPYARPPLLVRRN